MTFMASWRHLFSSALDDRIGKWHESFYFLPLLFVIFIIKTIAKKNRVMSWVAIGWRGKALKFKSDLDF